MTLHDVQAYKKYHDKSCGAASLLMCLHFFDRSIPLNQTYETLIYNVTKYGHGEGAAMPGLWLYALQHGYQVTCHGKTLLPERPLHMEKEAFQASYAIYQGFLQQCILEDRFSYQPIRIEDADKVIEKCLRSKRLVIATVKKDPSAKKTSNVVITGISDNHIHINDAQGSKKKIPVKEFKNLLDIPYQFCIWSIGLP